MIANIKPYLSYKSSGITWLGDIPEGWDLRRAKLLLREVDERSTSGDEDLLSVSHIRGVVRRSEHSVTMFKAESYAGHKICRPGDLVVNTMWAWMGALGLSAYHGIVSPAYAVYRMRKNSTLLGSFANLLLRSPGYIASYMARSTGIQSSRLRLYPDEFLRTVLLVPPIEDQESIVRFLNHANTRINSFIRNKSKLIALLEEQRQVMIHREATCGIDLGVPFRTTGNPYLGRIPAHWDLVRLKDVASIQTGITLGKDYGGACVREYPYLRVANVQAGTLNLKSIKTIEVPEDDARRSTLKVGDVLMTEGGDIDKLGRGCVWRSEIENCLHQNHIFAVRCEDSLDPSYLASLMASSYGRLYFQIAAKQTTNLASINSRVLRAFPIPLPSLNEQKNIVHSLQEKTRSLDQAMYRARQEVKLLREFGTRLISDVVTGQLDVRAAAADLPEVLEPAAMPAEALDSNELELLDDNDMQEAIMS